MKLFQIKANQMNRVYLEDWAKHKGTLKKILQGTEFNISHGPQKKIKIKISDASDL